MHPATAFSPYYELPAGVPSDPCRHYGRRCRVGSTSRSSRMILVDTCAWCGHVMRTAEEISS